MREFRLFGWCVTVQRVSEMPNPKIVASRTLPTGERVVVFRPGQRVKALTAAQLPLPIDSRPRRQP